LIILNLGNNQLGDHGAQVLKINTALTILILGSNQIGNQCAQALIEVFALVETLKMNNTLSELDLCNRKIKSNFKSTIDQKLKINIINKKRSRCLQIVCFEKTKKIR
jgi:hypothetical protein